MAIQNIENAKILKKWMCIVGRQGFGDMAIEIARKIIERAEVGDYVSIAKEVGKMKAIATGANEDCYFSEKVHMGFYDQLHESEQVIAKNLLTPNKQ